MAEPELCVCCRRRPVDPAWRPFCGQRCKTMDLARWADGSYRIPGEPVRDEEDTENSKSKTEED
jgi:endogenous inhibitor of DNA gyrase (YacG/DUF329 family)